MQTNSWSTKEESLIPLFEGIPHNWISLLIFEIPLFLCLPLFLIFELEPTQRINAIITLCVGTLFSFIIIHCGNRIQRFRKTSQMYWYVPILNIGFIGMGYVIYFIILLYINNPLKKFSYF